MENENVLSETVINRLNLGAAQMIHIPFPEEFGMYAPGNLTTDDDMDRWVAEHIQVPGHMIITGRGAGRAYYGKDLIPCLVVTITPNKQGRPVGMPVRKVWADGRGGVR